MMLLVLIYKQNIMMVFLNQQLLMEDFIKYQEMIYTRYGMINMKITVDILHFFLMLLYFYKYLILYVVDGLKMKLIF